MVSIIIPVYNGAEFLEECLRSVMNQTYKDLEIIVIDDGSTDESGEICRKLAREDNRIVPVRQENAGVSAARNRGIDMSNGEYIMFVDADDLLTPNAVELLEENIRVTNMDMSIGACEMFRGNYKRCAWRGSGIYSREEIKQSIEEIRGLLCSPCGRLYKKEKLKDALYFEKNIPYGEDHIFNLKYCSLTNGISAISSVVYRYRMGGIANSVRYYPNKDELAVQLVRGYVEFFEAEGLPLLTKINVVYSGLLDCFIHYIAHCSKQEAIDNIKKTLVTFSPHIDSLTIDRRTYGERLAKAIQNKDSSAIYRLVSQKWSVPIVKKKLKKMYYKIFTKRI